jgi:hypothetical protein
VFGHDWAFGAGYYIFMLSYWPMTNARANFSAEVESRVLLACKRRCAFCFGLNSDASLKRQGQLAHIDRNSANNAETNAAYLCLAHHDEYDTQPSQSKGLTKTELIVYQKLLLKHLNEIQLWTDTRLPNHTKKRKGKTSLDVYNARIPIYRTTVEFLRTIAKDRRPENPNVWKFARDTEEALFLFDETIAEYLTLLFRKALRLHAVDLMRAAPETPGNIAELIEEQTNLSLWFIDQYDDVRAKFAPFLQLAD